MTSTWHHPLFDFYEIYIQNCKGHIKAAYQISISSNIWELRYTAGKLMKNYEETRSIQRTQTPPRLWPFTLSCHLDLKSRSNRLMSLDCIVPWYQVWCLWVCPTLLVNKIPAKRMHRFGRSFRVTVGLTHWLEPIEIVDLGSKVKVTVTQYPFLLYNSLLTSPL